MSQLLQWLLAATGGGATAFAAVKWFGGDRDLSFATTTKLLRETASDLVADVRKEMAEVRRENDALTSRVVRIEKDWRECVEGIDAKDERIRQLERENGTLSERVANGTNAYG